MSAKAERLIDIVNWGGSEHYKDRRPPWIKNHASLLSDDAYLDLPLAARGVLHGLWLIEQSAEGRFPRVAPSGRSEVRLAVRMAVQVHVRDRCTHTSECSTVRDSSCFLLAAC